MIYKIALTQLRGVGPMEGRAIMEFYDGAEGLFHETAEGIAKLKTPVADLADQVLSGAAVDKAKKELEFMDKYGIRAIALDSSEYPYRLKECPDAPIVLFCKGEATLNGQHMVGMVGTRRSTDYGRTLAVKLVEGLADKVADVTIVSGLAEGIDGISHKAALASSVPTVGVVAHGLDMIYPSCHRDLAAEMLAKGGCIVSEYVSGVKPLPVHFLARNRIIAGLSDALVVVETAFKGGSQNTAATASSYNRDVFAFPGRVGDARSEGCNSLIKTERAGMIEDATDLIRAMGWRERTFRADQGTQKDLFPDISEEDKEVMALLHKNPDGLQINQVAMELGKPVSITSAHLMQMEFAGLVRCLPGNLYKLS